MAATPATAFTPVMAQLTGNQGGNVQSLPGVNLAGGKERTFVGTITLASQAAATVFGIARLPLQAVITGITVITSVSLGSATIELGDAGNGNAAIYAAAQTLTSANTPTKVGAAATHGQPITAGYDCQTGASSPDHEDIILTTAAAALPASGTLTTIIEFAID